MSTPATQVHICSGVRLDNRYQHTIFFPSQVEQEVYFAGKVVHTFPAYSHHRRNWELKVEATEAVARNWNYLYITNPGMRPYYYFINRVEYVSDTTVKLFLELDVIQTNLFNMQLLPCFVERQHTPTDVIGENTVPEGLEIGPYCNYHIWDQESISEMGVLVMSALDLHYEIDDEVITTAYGRKYDGVYSGLGIYAFDSITKLEYQLNKLDQYGKAEAIVAIWMYPKKLVRLAFSRTGEAPVSFSWDSYEWNDLVYGAYVQGIDEVATTLATFDNYEPFQGYTPKNKKLYTYPYNLLYVTNNQGGTAEYRFEHFTQPGANYNFQMYGAIAPDGGVKLAPAYYNAPGAHTNYDEGLGMGAYPTCAWDSDTYKVWLAQNSAQHQLALDTAGYTTVAGLASVMGGVAMLVASGGAAAGPALGGIAGGAGMMYGAYNQVAGIMAQKEDAKAQPPQAKGAYSTSVNVSCGRQTFTFYYKSVREEYARQLDDYFTMYGYQVNRVQVPIVNARPAFTFVKTVGCKVAGQLSNEDIVTVERIFDNGVTFWKDGDSIGNYTLDNAV